MVEGVKGWLWAPVGPRDMRRRVRGGEQSNENVPDGSTAPSASAPPSSDVSVEPLKPVESTKEGSGVRAGQAAGERTGTLVDILA